MRKFKASEELPINNDPSEVTEESKLEGKVNLSIDLPQQDYVVCVVCGHKNKKEVGICEMCSNYLFV